MPLRKAALEYLHHLGTLDSDRIDLFETSLQLAVLDYPKDNLQAYRDHKDLLGEDVSRFMRGQTDTVAARVGALRDILVEQHRYHGDSLTYDDLQNANMIRVIDRRMGLPITLGILFLVVARAQGWETEGLNFPGHFLVRLVADGQPEMIDPFHEGQPMDVQRLRHMLKAAAGQAAELTPDHYLPMNNRDILLRLQNNIKLRHVQAGRLEHAVKTVETMKLFAPQDATLWREEGLLLAALGEINAAIDAIEQFHAMANDEKTKRQAALILQQLKNR